jgi:hypothetical protein
MNVENFESLAVGKVSELQGFAAKSGVGIDTSDSPEITDCSGARRGVFHTVLAQLGATIRLDGDIVSWFIDQGGDAAHIEARINRTLRNHGCGARP